MNILKINGISTNLSSRTNAKNRADKQYASNGLYKDTISFTSKSDPLTSLYNLRCLVSDVIGRADYTLRNALRIKLDAEMAKIGGGLKNVIDDSLPKVEGGKYMTDKAGSIFLFIGNKLMSLEEKFIPEASAFSSRTLEFNPQTDSLIRYSETLGDRTSTITFDKDGRPNLNISYSEEPEKV